MGGLGGCPLSSDGSLPSGCAIVAGFSHGGWVHLPHVTSTCSEDQVGCSLLLSLKRCRN